MKKHYRHENDCLNCGTQLQGKYCHSCGQENLQIKESFGHMITHAVGDYFHFDHQFFHTLKPLFISPGKLTNEYMAGKRVQYLHPVKMYIFISLVYFVLLFSNSGHGDESVKHDKKNASVEWTDSNNYTKKLPPLSPEQKNSIESKLNAISAENGGKIDTTKKLETIKIRQSGNEGTDTTYVFNSFTLKKLPNGELDTTYTYEGLTDLLIESADDGTYEDYVANQNKLPENQRDNFLDRYLNKKAYAWKDRGGDTTRSMIEEGVKHNAPKMMFFLLPLFALFLKISFYKNKKFYVEHLIFSFHFHCFMFLFLTTLMLVKMPIPDSWTQFESWLDIIAAACVMWYLYSSLRVVYKRSIFRTITKTIGLTTAYLLTLLFSLLLLVFITAIFSV